MLSEGISDVALKTITVTIKSGTLEPSDIIFYITFGLSCMNVFDTCFQCVVIYDLLACSVTTISLMKSWTWDRTSARNARDGYSTALTK